MLVSPASAGAGAGAAQGICGPALRALPCAQGNGTGAVAQVGVGTCWLAGSGVGPCHGSRPRGQYDTGGSGYQT